MSSLHQQTCLEIKTLIYTNSIKMLLKYFIKIQLTKLKKKSLDLEKDMLTTISFRIFPQIKDELGRRSDYRLLKSTVKIMMVI